MKFHPSRRSPSRKSRVEQSHRRLKLESLESRRLLASDVIIAESGDRSSYDRTFDGPSNTATYSPNVVGLSGPLRAEIFALDLQTDLDLGINVIVETTEAGSSDPGDITLDADILKTLGGNATLRFNADNSIIASNSTIASSAGTLDVTFNADRDFNSTGGIVINSSVAIDSNGGDVVLGGGLDPLTEFASDSTNSRDGVFIAGSVLTSGGDIEIRGRSFSQAGADGVELALGASLDSGAGAIRILGEGGAGSTDTSGDIGVRINTATIQSNGGGIEIRGSHRDQPALDGVATEQDGVLISDSRVEDFGAGAILIDGVAGNGLAGSQGVNITASEVSITEVRSNGGGIMISGRGVGTGDFNSGVDFFSSGQVTISDSASGDILITGTSPTNDPANFNAGIVVPSQLTSINTGGNVSLLASVGPTTSPMGTTFSPLVSAQTLNLDGEFLPGSVNVGDTTFDANLNLGDAAILNFDVNGVTPGIDSDRMSVVGTVNLNDATLMTTGTIASNLGQTVEIINNDGSDPIVGTFAGLPEGAFTTINGLDFAISYIGGDGNDVTLTEIVNTTISGTATDDTILLRLNSAPAIPEIEVLINSVLTHSFPLGSISDLTINGLDGSDTLTVDYSGGNPVPAGGVVFDGGSRPGDVDSLTIFGGSASMVTHTFLNPNDGSVDIDGSVVNYVGLEPITDDMNANDRVFNFDGGTETISLGADPNKAGANLIDSSLGESVSFTNPIRSLTINSGDGDDVINITTLDSGNQSSLIVDGGGGTTDILKMNGVNLDTNGQGRGLELRELETIDINTGTISNNTANLSNGRGGGILIENSTSGTNTIAMIDTVTITNNTADFGGGVYASGVDLTIEDATTISGNSVSVDGGGVYIDGGSVSILSTTISGNTAGDSGGGVYVDSGALTLEVSTISNNQALGSDSGGGGVYLLGSGPTSSPFSIIDTRFASNRASSGGGGLEIVDNPGTITDGIYELNSVTGGVLDNQGGGAIVVLASSPITSPAISITGVTLRQNTAPTGGGLAAVNPNLTLDSVLIENNSTINTGSGFATEGVGGGIAVLGDVSGGVLSIVNSKIQNNNAVSDAGGIGAADVDVTLTDTTITSNGFSVAIGGRGGGIGVQGIQRTPVLTANRVTIDNNVSMGDGGGVGVINAGLDFTNVTISDNESLAGTGGGLVYDNTDPDTILSIAFSTFASNTDPTFPSNIAAAGASIDMFATLFADGIGVFDPAFTFNSLGFNTNNSMPPGLNDPTDINMFDTPLLDLADNGGSVATRRTAVEIPQVNDRVTSFGTLVDARGVTRSSSVDPNADVGAVEFVGIRITDSLGQTNITANEGDGVLTVLVGPDHTLPGVASIDVSLVTAGTNPASIPGDLSATNSTLTFPAGDSTPQSFTITLTEDGEIESTETFGINATTTSPLIDAATIQSIGDLTDNDVFTPIFDLSLIKSVDKPVASPGADQVTYTITVTNEADDLTDPFDVTDVLPDGLSLVSINAPGATSQSFDVSTREILVQYASIPAAEIRTFTITANVLASATGALTNTATVVAPTVTESDTLNNSDSSSVTLSPVADVRVFKTVDIATAQPGQQLTYTIVVDNFGPAVAASVTAVDTLPSGVTFVSGTGPNGPLSASNGIVTVDIGQLAPNEFTQFTIVVTINDAVISDQVNSVSVSTITAETDSTNNTDNATTRIAPSNASVVGHVYCDANGDGMETPGEESIGATVFIDSNNNGLLDGNETSTLTNSLGDYSFSSLPSGTQQITLIVPNSTCSAVPAKFPAIGTGVELGEVIRDAFAFDVDGDGLDEFLTVAENSRDLIIVSASSFQSGLSSLRIPLDNRPQAVHAWRPLSGGSPSPETFSTSASIAVAAFGGEFTDVDGLQKTNPGVVYTIDEAGNVGQFAAGRGPIDVVVDDFDGDNLPDYLVASYLSNNFHLKLSGSQSTVQIGTANGAVHVNSADLDGDGDRDLILGGYGLGEFSLGSLQVRLNDGQGNFMAPMSVPFSSRLISTAAADVDRGSQTNPSSAELIALGVDGRVTVYSVSESGVSMLSTLKLEPGTSKIVAGLIDGDSEIDLAVVRNKPRTVISNSTTPAKSAIDLLLNDGSGNFKLARSTDEIANPVAIAFASVEDFDRSDLVVAEQSTDNQGGSTTFLRLGLDQQSVTVSGGIVMTANFNPSSDHSRFDVNGDAQVTTVDVLQIINEMNASESGASEPTQTAAGEPNATNRTVVSIPSTKDVNQDGHVTALDALMVINYINSLDSGMASAEPTSNAESLAAVSDDETHREAVDALMLEPGTLF
ncbi:FG-GAP-like repeat-containing protein [Aporhodopirellula aestuarii]|uniref:Dockerin type I domain-containing protein n=1 Tax=Aporhodopirellula aestuarii TaxID=2950107 RepID=A0ABT0UET6_9BACT|nr:FG-GAP-like repeat-containing protein [Aporhodopirellula aestuarii]MCM2374920.1 dockerin type I domain-containing protein [Aporhodopirellula aestuarii]